MSQENMINKHNSEPRTQNSELKYEVFENIRAIVLDIDGVCTDNIIMVTDHGEF